MSNNPWQTLLDITTRNAVDYLTSLDGRSVAPAADASQLRALLGTDLPSEPQSPVHVINDLAVAGHQGTMGSAGRRFFGFVMGGSLPTALAADWLASAWDQNAAIYASSPVAAVVEDICQRWILDILGLPSSSSVGFVTGAQMATFTALGAARHHVLREVSWDVESSGLSGAPSVTVLATRERHASVDRALRYLGFGTDSLVEIGCDGNGAIKPAELAATLQDVAGPKIVCVQSGNINTGAIDPLDEVCEVAREHGAWVHVDGAIGLWAAVSSRFNQVLAGLERADSWAADGHKWLNVPYDCGVVVCAHPGSHHAFTRVSGASPYLVPSDERDEMDWTPEWSRRARAVPLYAAMRSLGRSGIAEIVERGCAHASRFAELLSVIEGVEILNEVVLNQVLVRFRSPEGAHDVLTDCVVRAVQQDGTCWLGGTTWQGSRAMRISVSGWATTADDVDISVAAIERAYQLALGERHDEAGVNERRAEQ